MRLKNGINMKKTMLLAIVIATELFAPSFVQAQGTLYVSNLGQTPTGSAAIASDAWIAQRIITGNNSSGYILNAIQLLMGAASGNPSGFNVSIYSSLSDEPNNSLGNLVGSDPSAGGIFTYTASGLTLSPSTVYFIVQTAATPMAQGAYDWSVADSFTQGSDVWTIDDFYFSSPDGTSWTEYVRENVFQMAIYATPVPEPSTLGLTALGGLLLAWHRWSARAI
jgi:hypothetical protein